MSTRTEKGGLRNGLRNIEEKLAIMANLGDQLIKKGVLGPEQLQEAETIANSRKLKLQDAIVQLGYASSEQVMRTLAELHCPHF